MSAKKAIVLAAAILMCAAYAEADYGSVEVRETAGIDRRLWPVQVGVPIPAEAFEEAGADTESLLLVQALEDGSMREVGFQILDQALSACCGKELTEQRTRLFEIAFITELPAYASLEFRLYYREPPAEVAPAEDGPRLEIEMSEGLGRGIDTGAARFGFHPESGQMTYYELDKAGYRPKLSTRSDPDVSRPIHGPGDVWAPGHGPWGHLRSWVLGNEEHGIRYLESQGPLAWHMVRSGYVPNTSRNVEASISYTAFAGMPFVFTSSHISFKEDIAVNSVRNNQLIFNRGEHTHALYMTPRGEMKSVLAYLGDPDTDPLEQERLGDLGLGQLPPDLPFAGMMHEERGYGIGFVNLTRANLRAGGIAGPQDAGSHFYFFDNTRPKMDFFDMFRAEVWPAEFDGETYTWRHTVVPAGSVFSSRSAILIFPVLAGEDADNALEYMRRWIEKLRNPPRIVAR